jgi:hypothetical protein
MTENLTQEPDRERHRHSRARAPGCWDAEVQEGGNASPKYPTENQTVEYHRDVVDSPQVIEGEGGTLLEPLCTELVCPELTPNDPLVVEGVTNTGEKGEDTPRYNLRLRPGRNV